MLAFKRAVFSGWPDRRSEPEETLLTELRCRLRIPKVLAQRNERRWEIKRGGRNRWWFISILPGG